jgi:H+-transporting ATPase
MVSCVSSLILLEFLLSSWNPGSVFQYLGLGGISYGQVTTAIYLKVSVSDFLTLFSARGGSGWFWSSRPSNILLAAGGVALSVSTILAIAWPASHPDEIYTLGLVRRKPYALFMYIWLYCIVWWFVQVFITHNSILNIL